MNMKFAFRLLLFFLFFGGLLVCLSVFYDLHQMFGLDHRELVRFIIIVFSTYVVVMLIQRSLHLFFKKTISLIRGARKRLKSLLGQGAI